MWWPILQAVRNQLTGGPASIPGTVPVHIGASTVVPTTTEVRVLRGPATLANEWAERGRHEQTLYLEHWAHAHDPGDAYRDLAQLEDQVRVALFAGPLIIGAGVSAVIEAQQLETDGDVFSPSVASRLTLRVRCRRKTLAR